MTILDTIKKKVNLQEETNAIQQILIQMYLKKRSTLKELSTASQLPIPVVSAIRKELARMKLVNKQQEFMLSQRGALYVEHELGWANIDVAYYQQLEKDGPAQSELVEEMTNQLSEIISDRPHVNLKLDQAFCTIDTAIKRALLLLKERQLIGKNILFLGDDDLISLTTAILLEHLKKDKHEGYKTQLTVYEYDSALIEFIEKQAEIYQLQVRVVKHDLTKGHLELFQPEFDVVMTDPPYTISGLKLFLSRALAALKTQEQTIYLSFGEKSPTTDLLIQQLFYQQQLVVKTILREFNLYDGASVLGNKSNLYILQRTRASMPLIKSQQDFHDPLYTRAVKANSNLNQTSTTYVGVGRQLKQLQNSSLSTIPLGYHYLLELENCDKTRLMVVKQVEFRMKALVKIGGLTPIKHYFHQFKPWGVSGIVVLAESHFTIHTWPEYDYAAVDLFVCQPLADAEGLCQEIQNAFRAQNLKIKYIERGKEIKRGRKDDI